MDALRRYRILDTPPEPIYDEITRLAALICGTPIALITFVDSERLWAKALVGTQLAEIPRKHSFCAHALQLVDPLLVSDAREDPRFCDIPCVAGEAAVRFYAGVPLRTDDGHVLGTLCVLDRTPRQLDATQIAALRSLAGQVVTHLEIRRRLEEAEKAEREKRIAEKWLRSITDSVRCLLWSATIEDGNGDDLVWSIRVSDEAAAQRFLPVERADGAGFVEAWQNCRFPHDAWNTTLYRDSQVRVDRSYTIEYRCRTSDGDVRWLNDDVRIERVGQDRWNAMGVTTDITERKRTEERLVTQQDFLRSVIDTDPNLIYVKGSNGAYTLANRAVAELFGVSLHAVIGRNDADFVVDPEQLRTILDDDRRVLETRKEIVVADQPFTDAAGRTRWFQTVKRPIFSPANREYQVLGISSEITDRKRMEQELRDSRERLDNIVGSLNDVVWSLSARTFEVLYLSPAAEEVYGRPVKEFQENPGLWLDVIHSQDQLKVAESSGDLFTNGFVEREFRIVRPDGGVRWLRDRARLSRGDDGELIRIDGIATDITVQKRLQSQILHTEKLAALGELVAGVAHEINNPLAAISGHAQLLEMHEDTEVQGDARSIRLMIDRATNIVRSLLTFARQECDNRRPASLNAAVEATIAMIRHKLRRSDVQLTLELDPELPYVSISVSQIEQVLLNLINNAEHALRDNDAGDRLLTVRTGVEIHEELGRCVWVTVADNGSGIPEPVLRRIFDPFYTTKDVGEGTGLGLSICHGIATAHGGDIAVESVAGAGSSFTLHLPLGD